MILYVSGRCDIVAFYTPWFINRYNEGFVDVRNPFNKHQVSRINFSDVDAILFCTKNPIPILNYLDKINKPIIFHVTLTPYKDDIEVNVKNKKDIIDAIKKLSSIVGIDNIYVRYDPIFINDKYTLDYHIKAFNKLCESLNSYVKHIIISFLDDYKNVRKNLSVLKYKDLDENDYEAIGLNFSKIAESNNMSVQTCFKERNLFEYGFKVEDCLSKEMAKRLTGKDIKKKWSARKGGMCNCVAMVDIGHYNSCKHFCKYCYANFDEKQVASNCLKHNPKSSLLIGELESDDIITIRKD